VIRLFAFAGFNMNTATTAQFILDK